MPLTKLTESSIAEPPDELLGAAAAVGLGDQHQLDVALRAQLRERLEQGGDALHRGVGAGHGQDPALHPWLGGRHEAVVDAEQDHLHPGQVDPEVRGDVAAGGLRRRQDPAGPAGDLALHPEEAVPPAQRELLAERRGVGEVDPPVEGDRVVQRRDQRQAHLLDVEHAVAEHLVVVDDVEVVDAGPQQPGHAGAERLRLREAGGAHRQELLDVHQVAELARLRDPERVRLAVEVQARHLGQLHARVEHGVGLAGEDLDLVPEVGQLPAQVADVDALTAAMGLASGRTTVRRATSRPSLSAIRTLAQSPGGAQTRGPDEVERVPIMSHSLIA